MYVNGGNESYFRVGDSLTGPSRAKAGELSVAHKFRYFDLERA